MAGNSRKKDRKNIRINKRKNIISNAKNSIPAINKSQNPKIQVVVNDGTVKKTLENRFVQFKTNENNGIQIESNVQTNVKNGQIDRESLKVEVKKANLSDLREARKKKEAKQKELAKLNEATKRADKEIGKNKEEISQKNYNKTDNEPQL